MITKQTHDDPYQFCDKFSHSISLHFRSVVSIQFFFFKFTTVFGRSISIGVYVPVNSPTTVLLAGSRSSLIACGVADRSA